MLSFCYMHSSDYIFTFVRDARVSIIFSQREFQELVVEPSHFVKGVLGC
jgi:hypothetical protein